jgi:hypothetical protein
MGQTERGTDREGAETKEDRQGGGKDKGGTDKQGGQTGRGTRGGHLLPFMGGGLIHHLSAVVRGSCLCVWVLVVCRCLCSWVGLLLSMVGIIICGGIVVVRGGGGGVVLHVGLRWWWRVLIQCCGSRVVVVGVHCCEGGRWLQRRAHHSWSSDNGGVVGGHFPLLTVVEVDVVGNRHLSPVVVCMLLLVLAGCWSLRVDAHC